MTSKLTRVDREKKMSVNRTVLLVFSLLLLVIGVLGLLIPAESSLTSVAAAYNAFHLIAGFIGIVFWLAKKEHRAETFNIGFGLIDLYQALASYQHLFPEQYFRWTRADNILHIVIGLFLVVVGCYGMINRKSK
jgi:uncharacterized membrane protein HdeD (DUF308 family)